MYIANVLNKDFWVFIEKQYSLNSVYSNINVYVKVTRFTKLNQKGSGYVSAN